MAYKNYADRKTYWDKYYARNKKKLYADAVPLRAKRHEALNAYVNSFKEERGCADCLVKYPFYVLEFDHLRDKDRSVSDMVKDHLSLDRIKLEIAKCDVVCSNCHSIRTYNRRKISVSKRG